VTDHPDHLTLYATYDHEDNVLDLRFQEWFDLPEGCFDVRPLDPPSVEDVVRCVENHLPVALGYFRDGNGDTDAAKVMRGDLALSSVCDENEMFVYCTMDVLNLPGVGDFEDIHNFGNEIALAILGNTDTDPPELASPVWSKFYNDVIKLWLQRHNLKGKGL